MTVTAMPIRAVLRNPMRRYRRPDWDALIGQPIVSAARASPARIGEVESAPSRNVGTSEVRPKLTAPTPKETIAVVASSRRDATHGGRTGSAALRSTRINAANKTAPPANTP